MPKKQAATVAFAAKTNMADEGSGGVFAAYLGSVDGIYLGDVGERRLGGGWWALPAGESARDGVLYPGREIAGAALAARRG